jgi:hypothetical protein
VSQVDARIIHTAVETTETATVEVIDSFPLSCRDELIEEMSRRGYSGPSLWIYGEGKWHGKFKRVTAFVSGGDMSTIRPWNGIPIRVIQPKEGDK